VSALHKPLAPFVRKRNDGRLKGEGDSPLGTARRTGSFTPTVARKRDRTKKWVYLLAESLPLTSDVLCQEHSSKRGEGIGLRVVESSKDRLPLWDRESDNSRLALPSLLEPRGQIRLPGASEQTSQLEDVGVWDRDAGELHAHRATRAESRENAAWWKRRLSVDVAPQRRRIHISVREGEWAGSALPPPLPLPGRRAGWPARQYWRPSRSRERAPPHDPRGRRAPARLHGNGAPLASLGEAARGPATGLERTQVLGAGARGVARGDTF
jgi:hypothetical protein